jgi:hypothetical protein
MKDFFRIFALIVFVLLLFLFAAPHLLEFIGRAQVPEMTPEKAKTLCEKAGGINELNRETAMLINQLGTNALTFLSPEDLTNAPAISSLYSICKEYSGRDYSGTGVAIFPDGGRHIEIKFGNHWSLKFFYIFNPNAPVTFNAPANWFQVTSNIFASR